MDESLNRAIARLWRHREHLCERGSYSKNSIQEITREFTRNGIAKLLAASMIVSESMEPYVNDATDYILNEIAKETKMEKLTNLIVLEALQHVSPSRLKSHDVFEFLKKSKCFFKGSALIDFLFSRIK